MLLLPKNLFYFPGNFFIFSLATDRTDPIILLFISHVHKLLHFIIDTIVL